MSDTTTIPPASEREHPRIAMARCAICGFGYAYGIHLPALTGPNKGKPWGHEFVPIQPPPPPEQGGKG